MSSIYDKVSSLSSWIVVLYLITMIGQIGTYVLDAKEKDRNLFVKDVMSKEGKANTKLSLVTNGLAMGFLTIALIVLLVYDDEEWVIIVLYIPFFVCGIIFFVASCLNLNTSTISSVGELNKYTTYVGDRPFLEFRKMYGIIDLNDYDNKFKASLVSELTRYKGRRIAFFVLMLPIYVVFVCIPAVILALGLLFLVCIASAKR